MNRLDSQLVGGLVTGVPQPFALATPVTRVEVVTEPTATLKVTAKTKAGSPVEGASVYANPNVMRIGGIFGWMRKSSEEPFRTMDPLPDLPYSAVTDKNGVAVLRNLPAVARGLDINHPQFEVPLDADSIDRYVRFELSPGATHELEVILQPKGKQFIGSVK